MPAKPTMSRRTFFLFTGMSAAGAMGLAACGSDDPGNAASTTSSDATPSGTAGADVDTTVWREYGTPLAEPTGSGILDGGTVAVKDLYAVEGHVIGAGNEEWLAQARPELSSAPAVTGLLSAGAAIAGIARTDEFAYSLAGTNGHYGIPPNPTAPDRIPGGSTSGSGAAVALGEATIGLGTDTGGSIRIPASYQGLFGIRTTHGAISREGLIPLAPSFDTVGWLTSTREALYEVADVLEPVLPETVDVDRVVYARSLLDIADPEVAGAVEDALRNWSGDLPVEEIQFDAAVLPDWVGAFQTRQGYEAWQAHGAWIEEHWDSLNPDVRSRFETAAGYTDADLTSADRTLDEARGIINDALGNSVLILPSASSVAPDRESAELGGETIETARADTFQLTCLAGITGRPAVSSPLPVDGPPMGICAVGPRNSDRALARLVTV
ncbi:Amidase [Corynebacterium glyciniphilum AJ 3170]|uniref:Amidase n=1 Tax=Corynebacterium glyciniphilum AJ 3170 TaxID=1404245 RepID=X5DVE6_9CORY|nr:amidase family protein [Corynebacterium glyciniphilum]AHW64627.1 Amidase [Corynebacterium glyciniphilum AJ 3170]